MEFGLLGPLMVRRGDSAVSITATRQRVLLAALLLNANRVVPAQELAGTLWESGPPASARVTLQNYVKRLRLVLGDADHSRIATRPGGYLISVTAGELDVSRFEALQGQAREAARGGSWAQASTRLHAALALWRGPPLSDVPCDVLSSQEIPRLTAMRLQAIEDRIDADLHLGLQDDIITELQQLCRAHPMRERLHALLMLALYQGGRQAEALEAYRATRATLVAELGVEPGPELRQAHQCILAGDHGLAASPAPGHEDHFVPAARPSPVVPRQLPAKVGHFVGRAAEMRALTRSLDEAAAAGTMMISTIGGTAGIGKTALAVHWAHQVAERFPDGQLHVNLRGYDPGQPMPAADALAGFLRALGMPGQEIPADEAERAARYRSLLAGRRIMVILDNASEVEQVRPLLPGTPTCAAVVTSRDSLAGLVARDGAWRVDLEVLPLDDAVGLLRALIGGRVDGDRAAAGALADLCARLPLALRVAAEFSAARPAVALAGLAGGLADQQRRLDLLDAGGDPRTAVRAVFSWSYRHLSADAARAFRLLGLHPGPDLDRYAAAALTGTAVGRAGRRLDQLARVNLIHSTRPGRYRMHDLLHAYADELAAAEDGEEERRAALTRLFDYYLHAAAAAMDTLFPAERCRRPRIRLPADPGPPVTVPTAAREWIDAERATLVAVAAHTATDGWPAHTTRLAATLFRYLDAGGHYPEATVIHSHARRAARESGDRAAEAIALISLGVGDLRQGRYQQATGHLQQALALHRATGDRGGAARTLHNLGLVDFQQGRYQEATGHLQRALILHRATGDRNGEARTLGNLGLVDLRQGRYQKAAGHLQRALTLHRATGDRNGEAFALANLGDVYLRRGRYQQATGHLQRALALFGDIGDRSGQAHALANLGDADLRQGHYQQATDHHQRALALFRETGDRSGEAEALNGLGAVQLAAGRPGQAHARHTEALAVARQIGDHHQQSRAHNGIAHTHHAPGDPATPASTGEKP